jgi:hypothetical protein
MPCLSKLAGHGAKLRRNSRRSAQELEISACLDQAEWESEARRRTTENAYAFPGGRGSFGNTASSADNNEHYQIDSLAPSKDPDLVIVGVSGGPRRSEKSQPKPRKSYDFIASPPVPVTLDIRPAHGLNSGSDHARAREVAARSAPRFRTRAGCRHNAHQNGGGRSGGNGPAACNPVDREGDANRGCISVFHY